ncbi:Pleckstrin y domain-containing A member 5 [Halocaridina rubra]|uniref:Pleckstrin y domain-containing A member 5 n=1 Tax=Halocaridina rubra TaxID=373956 RepID=A0AAN8WHE1_HALRR
MVVTSMIGTPIHERPRMPTPTEDYEFLCEATSPNSSAAANTPNNNDARKIQGSRRRSGGSWVKTPGLKRPEVSAVTLQGWLYKQGADGLQLWKKRWFVLSEYCLYYYKGEDYVWRDLARP